MVLHDAAVRDAPRPAGHPRERAFDHGPVLPVNGLEVRILGANTVFAAEPVMGVDPHLLAQLRSRALGHERARGAGTTKTHASLRADRPDDARRTRHALAAFIDGEVINGEPAGNSTAKRHRFDDRRVTGGRDLGEELAAAIGRITQRFDFLVANAGVSCDEFHPARRVTVFWSGCFGQSRRGRQAGLRLHRDMSFEPVDLLLPALMRVTCFGIHGRDDPVRGDPAGDLPPPVRAIRSLGRFHVLPGDQSEQGNRFLLLVGEGIRIDTGQQGQRVGDEPGDQLVPSSQVIPGDIGLARLRVVMASQPGHGHVGAGDLPPHAADLRDELRDGVLTGDGVLKDRRVQRPTLPPRQRPRLRDDLGHGFEDTVRPLARGEAAAPVDQHRRVKRRLRQREPARRFPAQIKGDRLRCFPVGEVVQRLQHHDRRDHISRRRRAAKLGREQVLERVVREQIVPVLGEERKHRPDREQMPRQHLNIVNLTLTIIMTLHDPSLNQPREST